MSPRSGEPATRAAAPVLAEARIDARIGARELIEALQALRDVAAPWDDAAHWQQLAIGMQRLTRALGAWLLLDEPGAAVTRDTKRLLGAAVSNPRLPDPLDDGWRSELLALQQRAAAQGHATCPGRSEDGQALWWAALPLPRLAGGWLLLAISDTERPQLNELLLRAQLVADVPQAPRRPAADHHGGAGAEVGANRAALSGSGAEAAPSHNDAGAGFGAAPLSELGRGLIRHEHFGPAALDLVNGIASLTGAVQVVLGWRASDSAAETRLKIAAISHRDKLDRFAHPVQLTEDVFDETLDHIDGVRLLADGPEPAAGPVPAHALLLQELRAGALWSLPLRRDAGDQGSAHAVLLLAFDEPVPGEALAQELQATLHLLLPWLQVLHQQQRPWPLKAAAATRRALQPWIGPGRIGWKLGAVVASAALAYALLASWEYRISAAGQLATDSTRLVSAPLDGRIDEARVTAGDAVREGAVLAAFDTRELRQQESDARAELKRFTAEADKARAAGALSELEVATARGAQAQARLNRTLDQLALAEARAPFDGVVVEGERKELQGAPVRKGDKLYRLARIEGLYATLQVAERDAAQVQPGASGELVLVSRPDEKIALRVLSVIPVAQLRGAEGNQFLVRAEVLAPPQPWWRPGMSGTARIDAGERQVAWILTHRIVDALRLALWW